MAEQGDAGQPTLVARATQVITPPGLDIPIAQSLCDEVASLLGLEDETARLQLSEAMSYGAEYYKVSKFIFSQHPGPHASRAMIIDIAGSLEKALQLLSNLGPEHSIALNLELNNQATEATGSRRTLPTIIADITRLSAAAASFSGRYKPKGRRPRNIALEHSITFWMQLFEGITGKRATVMLKKDGVHSPRPSSPEAEAIIKVFLALDDKLTATTIINKIAEIGRRHKGKPHIEYLGGVIVGAKITPF